MHCRKRECRMENYKKRIKECIEYLNSIRFPCEDWTEDKKYFDQLEREFSDVPEDVEGKQLLETLKKLIDDKRTSSLNMNKTAEDLFAGWND